MAGLDQDCLLSQRWLDQHRILNTSVALFTFMRRTEYQKQYNEPQQWTSLQPQTEH